MSLVGPANDACSQSLGDDTPTAAGLFLRQCRAVVEGNRDVAPLLCMRAGGMNIILF